MGGVPSLEQNYQYGLYGKGGNIPFGGITARPYAQPVTTIEPTTGISIPTQHSFVNDENGNKIKDLKKTSNEVFFHVSRFLVFIHSSFGKSETIFPSLKRITLLQYSAISGSWVTSTIVLPSCS